MATKRKKNLLKTLRVLTKPKKMISMATQDKRMDTLRTDCQKTRKLSSKKRNFKFWNKNFEVEDDGFSYGSNELISDKKIIQLDYVKIKCFFNI